ncbi:hypothetical protein M422DRAFT_24973 [Sphaerobolus stellatus SS14]|nr:hypothetical protein M422DRAFT_24973 [Sphaerobolus stellatus SS14]
MSSSQKNYAAAFASLQSSFGASGTAPCMPSTLLKSKSKSTPASSRNTVLEVLKRHAFLQRIMKPLLVIFKLHTDSAVHPSAAAPAEVKL